ncbi:hypothetical protein CRENBAI_008205 [Crenichthys baileyi]|uniref:Uncharacterized protein n=1 Tax=Crenichthys baileyi TaxID=28760 RepID=A0AAV9SLB5_9TELE
MALSHEDLSLLSIRRAGGRHTAARYVLYGYMCAYWACMTGHRPSVFTNMKDTDIATAELEGSEEGVLIRVADHKTTLQFGEASLALKRAELAWIKRLNAIKEKLDSTNEDGPEIRC